MMDRIKYLVFAFLIGAGLAFTGCAVLDSLSPEAVERTGAAAGGVAAERAAEGDYTGTAIAGAVGLAATLLAVYMRKRKKKVEGVVP